MDIKNPWLCSAFNGPVKHARLIFHYPQTIQNTPHIDVLLFSLRGADHTPLMGRVVAARPGVEQ